LAVNYGQGSLNRVADETGGQAFGMVMYSKRVDALARAAIVEAIRLDEQEAPQRETERQKKKDDENRVQQEKDRRANKAPFRP
jgi:hypothetical protein